MVNGVDAHLAGCVYYSLVVEKYPDVHYAVLLVLEESDVARLRLGKEINVFTHLHLL